MKRLVLISGLVLGNLIYVSVNVKAQCPNLNFSMGDFTNWQAYTGTCSSNNYIINPSPVVPTRHTIMNAAELNSQNKMQDERCISIRKVPDLYRYLTDSKFEYAAKLGNEQSGSQMEALSYTMTVDSSNSLLIVHFAWSMQNPINHPLSDQPQFTMAIKDAQDRPMSDVPCSFINFIANQNLDGLACKTIDFLARDWTTVGFSLERFIGQTIKIYFETRDCTQGIHFGYAYIVAECRPMTLDLMYCEGQYSAKFLAPDGFKTYKWKRSSKASWSIVGDKKTAQNISVSDPIDGEIFTCEVTSELGAECSATLKTVVAKTSIAADFFFGVKDEKNHVEIPYNWQRWYDTCSRTATFVDLSSVKNSKKNRIMWEILNAKTRSTIAVHFDSLFTYTFPDPKNNEPETYLIRLTVNTDNYCEDTSKPIAINYITIYPSPQIIIDGKTEMCENDVIYLKARAIRSVFKEHTWSWTDTNGVNHTAKGDSLLINIPGKYTLESLDTAGCWATSTHVVTALKPVFSSLKILNVDCYGGATGRIEHGNLINGFAPYAWVRWTFPDSVFNVTHGNSRTYFDLKAGTYVFEALDAIGCYLKGELEIEQNDSLTIHWTEFPTTCNLDNGRIKLSANGGVRPYKFEVRDIKGNLKSSSDSAGGLNVGTYEVIVIDALNCRNSTFVDINALPMPSLLVAGVSWETCNSENGSIWVTPQDASFPLKFTWNTNRNWDTLNTVNNLKAGIYNVKMLDNNGCLVEENIFVDSFPSPQVIVTTTPETCGREDGTITVSVISSDTNEIKYIWRGRSDTTAKLTGVKEGTYYLTVISKSKNENYTDSCIVEKTIVVKNVNGPIANFEANSYNVSSNMIFTLTDISQGSVKKWNWNMGDGKQSTGKIVHHSYSEPGDYLISLEVTDENGCMDTTSKVIHIYKELNVFIPNIFSPNGDGRNDKWKPKMSEYSKEGYQLSIFDRQGQLIFSTNDTEEEWDGKVKGKYAAPNTVYSYRIVVRDFTGQEHKFVGNVTILR